MTKQQSEAGADVSEDVRQRWMREGSNESREVTPEVQEGRDRMHARSNSKVPAEQPCGAEAQGLEHDGACLEPVTRLG